MTNETAALTADDVKYLKWAVRKLHVSAAVHTMTPDQGERSSVLRVFAEVKTDVPGAELPAVSEVVRDLPIAHTWVASYRELGNANVFTATQTGTATSRWEMTGLLCNLVDAGVRAGDTLRVLWQFGGHAAQQLRDAGFTVDSCHVQIQRDARGKGEFEVETRVVRMGTPGQFMTRYERDLVVTP